MVALTHLTARYFRVDGTPTSGTVSFTPSSPLIDAAENLVLPQKPVVFPINGEGLFIGALVSNEDPGLAPSGTIYDVTERIEGVSRTWPVSIPFTTDIVELALLAPVTGQPPHWEYVLQTTFDLLVARVVVLEARIAEVDGGSAGTVFP